MRKTTDGKLLNRSIIGDQDLMNEAATLVKKKRKNEEAKGHVKKTETIKSKKVSGNISNYSGESFKRGLAFGRSKRKSDMKAEE